LTRMDTPKAISDDSRTASAAGALRALLEKWRSFAKFSEAEMHRAQANKDRHEIATRKAEVCTLNVCIADLEAEVAKDGE
jgi:hypothetical protein